MSVIATRLPEIQAITVPSAIAISIRPKFSRPGTRKVARVATTMPQPAQTMPPRAVTGELIRFKPTMNSTAAAK
jgi:hypothetical protein